MWDAMRCGAALLAAVGLLGVGSALAQQSGSRPLAEIVNDLGSDQYAVRDRAQTELAKVPRVQLEALREAEKGAKDQEAKARLQSVGPGMEANQPLNTANSVASVVRTGTFSFGK